MITAGNNEMFAIAAEVTSANSDWLLGRIRFVFRGRVCGNWQDEADLRGCYSWLKDFREVPRHRFEPELFDLTASAVYERLVLPIVNSPNQLRLPEFYEDTFSRFHISHLGMSSFDRTDIVLIESPEFQRCVWKQVGDQNIYDYLFPAGHMQQVSKIFCDLLKNEAASVGIYL